MYSASTSSISVIGERANLWVIHLLRPGPGCSKCSTFSGNTLRRVACFCHTPVTDEFQVFKPSSIFHLWAPSIVSTFLAYFLGKGAFDGLGQTFERSWGSTLQWAVEPIFYPRWLVLTGTLFILFAGIYLFWRQYKRFKKSHDELVGALTSAFNEASNDLEKS